MSKKKMRFPQSKFVRELMECLKVIMIAVAVTFILNKALVANAQVVSGSMEETVMTGSWILVNRQAYLINGPERGDIVLFQSPEKNNKEYLKRIIALPGETVEGRDGSVYVDGAKIKESYIKEPAAEDFGPFRVPTDCYFMMGNNRNDSWDSRYWEIKYVNYDAIIGKAELEYYPEIKSLH